MPDDSNNSNTLVSAMAPDASTSPVEWGPEIRVDGKRPEWLGSFAKRIVYQRDGKDWYDPSPFSPDMWSERDISDNRDGWASVTAIRLPADHPHYRQPTTPERDPALWDRMAALVRRMGTIYRDAGSPAELPPRNYDMRDYAEARDIQNLLPKPVDPDLIEAREIAASMLEVAQGGTHIEETRRGERDGYVHVCIALAGIQRGRELAAPEVSHVG